MRVRLRSTEEAQKKNVSGWLRLGEDYEVLAVEHLPGGVVAYRLATKQGTPALFEADLFSVTDPRVDEAWVVQYSNPGEIDLVPEPWSEPGFWEDFFDGHPEAVARYQQVLRRMVEGGEDVQGAEEPPNSPLES